MSDDFLLLRAGVAFRDDAIVFLDDFLNSLGTEVGIVNSIVPLLIWPFPARIPMTAFGCDGFSGTGFTDDGNRFASMEIQVDAADGFDISVVSFKRNIEVADFKIFLFDSGLHLHFLHFRIERVAQSIGKQVERQHQNSKDHNRDDDLVRRD